MYFFYLEYTKRRSQKIQWWGKQEEQFSFITEEVDQAFLDSIDLPDEMQEDFIETVVWLGNIEDDLTTIAHGLRIESEEIESMTLYSFTNCRASA